MAVIDWNAAIVTCGGLCPGLNNVIREVVHTLTYMYGVNKVWGIVGGFQGFHNPDVTAGGEFAPIELTNKVVENIHHEGTYEKKRGVRMVVCYYGSSSLNLYCP